MSEVLPASPFRFNDVSLARHEVDAPLEYGYVSEPHRVAENGHGAEGGDNDGSSAQSFADAAAHAMVETAAYAVAGTIRGATIGSTLCLPTLVGTPAGYGTCVAGAAMVGGTFGGAVGILKGVFDNVPGIGTVTGAPSPEGAIVNAVKDMPEQMVEGLLGGLAGAFFLEVTVCGSISAAVKLVHHFDNAVPLITNTGLGPMKWGYVLGSLAGNFGFTDHFRHTPEGGVIVD